MKKGIWKDIKGYEGYYQVSNHGRIKSLDRYIKQNGIRKKIKGKILKSSIGTRNYLKVNLFKDGKQKTLNIHRIVAIEFVDGYFEGAVVNHIDKNTLNNNSDNLEWCTAKWNNQHKNGWDKSKEEELMNVIKQLYLNESKSLEEISKIFNVSAPTIKEYLEQQKVEIRGCGDLNRVPIKAYYAKNNKLAGEYESLTSCAKQLNLHVGNINAVLKGRKKTSGGYYFEYK